MIYSPLTLSRRHILGTFSGRCDPIRSVPVYLNDPLGEMIGFARENGESYADSVTFHIPEENCKSLASGRMGCSFDYDFSGVRTTERSNTSRRIKVTCFLLVARPSDEVSAAQQPVA